MTTRLSRYSAVENINNPKNKNYLSQVKGNMEKKEKVLIMNLEQNEDIRLRDGGSVEVICKRVNGLNGKVSSVDIELW